MVEGSVPVSEPLGVLDRAPEVSLRFVDRLLYPPASHQQRHDRGGERASGAVGACRMHSLRGEAIHRRAVPDKIDRVSVEVATLDDHVTRSKGPDAAGRL